MAALLRHGLRTRARPKAGLSLFWRVFIANAALLVAAAVTLGISPATVSWPIALTEAVVLGLGLVCMLAVNAVLLRLAFAPLTALATRMKHLDLLDNPPPLEPTGGGEVAAVVEAFNAMLVRLKTERRDNARRALLAQEAERRRVAAELHDEVGQTMTGVLLRLERLHDGISPDPPVLGSEAELAVYRIVQESLTNIARHPNASLVELTLRHTSGRVLVEIVDDGRGLPDDATAGAGLRGMRERATLVGGRLTVANVIGGGVRVSLDLPVKRRE
jgi:two-component system, NarL family, sensor histidine kinase UhpB